ncbi:MAG: DUF4062 domain-containing protein [Pseudomonadota bacterium]
MTYRVFLSSTGADLQPYRDAAYEAIRMTGATCVRMEDFEADPRRPAELCADEVQASDMLIGLIGFHYGGRIPPDQDRSFTELEIGTAAGHDPVIPAYFYVAPPGSVPATDQSGADLDAQRALRERLLADHTVGRSEHWESPYRLALQVMSIVFKAMPDVSEKDQFKARLQVEVLDRNARASEAEDDARQTLIQEKSALEAKLDDLDASFAVAQSRVAELEALLARESNEIGAERIARAEDALSAGDFEEADALLAEIEEDEDLAVQRAARAAYGRGQIADLDFRWEDAVVHFSKAVRLDPNSKFLRAAAKSYSDVGDYRRALGFGEDLVSLLRDQPESKELADAISANAYCLKALDRTDEMLDHFKEAFEIYSRTLKENDPVLELEAALTGQHLRDADRSEEAAMYIQKAIDLCETSLGLQSGRYARNVENFVLLLRDLNRFEQAEQLQSDFADLARDAEGEESITYERRLYVLAEIYKELGRDEEAGKLFQRCTELRSALQPNVGAYDQMRWLLRSTEGR